MFSAVDITLVSIFHQSDSSMKEMAHTKKLLGVPSSPQPSPGSAFPIPPRETSDL